MKHTLETLPEKYIVTCFRCGNRFEGFTEKSEYCQECGFIICPDCGYCKCEMSLEEQQIIQAMWNTDRDLVLWWRDHGRFLKKELHEYPTHGSLAATRLKKQILGEEASE